MCCCFCSIVVSLDMICVVFHCILVEVMLGWLWFLVTFMFVNSVVGNCSLCFLLVFCVILAVQLLVLVVGSCYCFWFCDSVFVVVFIVGCGCWWFLLACLVFGLGTVC